MLYMTQDKFMTVFCLFKDFLHMDYIHVVATRGQYWANTVAKGIIVDKSLRQLSVFVCVSGL